VELDKGDSIIIRAKGLQVQVYDVVKCADPATPIPICGGECRETRNEETASVVSGRAGRIRERLLPQLQVGGGCQEAKFDGGEEVRSCPMNPRFGDDTTRFERRRFVV
jgi:hypothetical protein